MQCRCADTLILYTLEHEQALRLTSARAMPCILRFLYAYQTYFLIGLSHIQFTVCDVHPSTGHSANYTAKCLIHTGGLRRSLLCIHKLCFIKRSSRYILNLPKRVYVHLIDLRYVIYLLKRLLRRLSKTQRLLPSTAILDVM